MTMDKTILKLSKYKISVMTLFLFLEDFWKSTSNETAYHLYFHHYHFLNAGNPLKDFIQSHTCFQVLNSCIHSPLQQINFSAPRFSWPSVWLSLISFCHSQTHYDLDLSSLATLAPLKDLPKVPSFPTISSSLAPLDGFHEVHVTRWLAFYCWLLNSPNSES